MELLYYIFRDLLQHVFQDKDFSQWKLLCLKELGHHISDHDAINSTAILFLPYKEAISLDYCQFTGLWVQ